MKETSCFCLKFGGKISYFDCHRYFLPLDHKFRLDNDTFKKCNIVLEGPELSYDLSVTCIMFNHLTDLIGYSAC
jgi:hypothetical protein